MKLTFVDYLKNHKKTISITAIFTVIIINLLVTAFLLSNNDGAGGILGNGHNDGSSPDSIINSTDINLQTSFEDSSMSSSDASIVNSSDNSSTSQTNASVSSALSGSTAEAGTQPAEAKRLPAIYLSTNNKVDIETKEEYIPGTFSMTVDDNTRYNNKYSISTGPVKIRGRGNSSWELPKKPYRLKFDKKISLFGLPSSKNWVLLASYNDKSLIRDNVASAMGAVLTNMPYAPQTAVVDIYLNGEYLGVYILSENIEIRTGRLELSTSKKADTGFIIEIGAANSTHVQNVDYIQTGYIKSALIKTPEIEIRTDKQMAFIADYMKKADEAVVSLKNYENYIDVSSFIDWFILHELTYNLDSSLSRNCYMVKNRGGKLQMGPPWNFTLAFGNMTHDNSKYNTWATIGSDSENSYVKTNWMNFLMNDVKFKSQLKERWFAVNDNLLNTAIKEIDECNKYTIPSAKENFKKWDILDKRAGLESTECFNIKTYEGQVEYLKTFLRDRKAWMDSNIGGF